MVSKSKTESFRPPENNSASGTRTILSSQEGVGSAGGGGVSTIGDVFTMRKDEELHTMTVSQLKHLKSMITRAKSVEENQQKLSFAENGISGCITAVLFAAGLLISSLFDGGFNLPNWFLFVCLLVLTVGILLAIFFIVINYISKKVMEKNRQSFLDEALELMPDTEQENVTR